MLLNERSLIWRLKVVINQIYKRILQPRKLSLKYIRSAVLFTAWRLNVWFGYDGCDLLYLIYLFYLLMDTVHHGFLNKTFMALHIT